MKKTCKTCIRWYGPSFDQCEVPCCGITDLKRDAFDRALGKKRPVTPDPEGEKFLRSRSKYVFHSSARASLVYGHPSELNLNHDCYFHLPMPRGLRWMSGVGRFLYFILKRL